MNGDEALALSPPSCSFLWDGSQGRMEDDGGRGCGTWAGHLRHRRASGLLGLTATGATEQHPNRRPHPSLLRHGSAAVKPAPPAGGGG